VHRVDVLGGMIHEYRRVARVHDALALTLVSGVVPLASATGINRAINHGGRSPRVSQIFLILLVIVGDTPTVERGCPGE
jgi:hypothetical protein